MWQTNKRRIMDGQDKQTRIDNSIKRNLSHESFCFPYKGQINENRWAIFKQFTVRVSTKNIHSNIDSKLHITFVAAPATTRRISTENANIKINRNPYFPRTSKSECFAFEKQNKWIVQERINSCYTLIRI